MSIAFKNCKIFQTLSFSLRKNSRLTTGATLLKDKNNAYFIKFVVDEGIRSLKKKTRTALNAVQLLFLNPETGTKTCPNSNPNQPPNCCRFRIKLLRKLILKK